MLSPIFNNGMNYGFDSQNQNYNQLIPSPTQQPIVSGAIRYATAQPVMPAGVGTLQEAMDTKAMSGTTGSIYNQYESTVPEQLQQVAYPSNQPAPTVSPKAYSMANTVPVNPAINMQNNKINMQNKSKTLTSQDNLGMVQTEMGAISSLANIYLGFKQQKLAKQNQREALALQRANYRNQAKAMNSQYRDQMSGRGTSVMSRGARESLGREYANRKVNESY